MTDIPCVWARCARAEHVEMIDSLATRLAEDGDRIAFEITQEAHPRGRRQVSAFLAQHHPFAVLWCGGDLDAVTLQAVQAAGVPVILLDASADAAGSVVSRWFPNKNRSLLSQLSDVYAQSPLASDALIRAGAPANRTHVFGPMERPVQILPYSEAERQDIAKSLQTRPVWLAWGIALGEADMIAQAHRIATGRSHRLLLIVTPEKTSDAKALAERFAQAGFRANLRSEGAEADENTQVHIADLPDEDGLWLRVAPLCFAGGSLTTGARHDPFEAAALGSATIHGAAYGPHAARFARLLRAGASFAISSPDKLGPAIVSLLSADRVARMATAGWDVTSSGAELSKSLTHRIQELLDTRGAA